jgi:anaerobic selenocysteine-containing dehydrogenase
MAALGEVLTDPGLDPPITAMIVHNCNPATITPDQNRVLAGLARDDLFTVVMEQAMTDTARYADLVLPATTQVEHLDLMNAWGHMYLSLNRPAIAPVGEALPNTEVFRRLAVAMGLDGPGLADDDETMVRQLLDSDHPWLDGIDLESLEVEGWVRLNVPEGFNPPMDGATTTPDGRLALGHLEYRPGDETPDGDAGLAARFPLGLLTRKQHVKFLNSHYGGFADHLPAEGEPLLDIHPDDAGPRSIIAGDTVRVFNDRGSVEMRAAVVDRVQPGLVTMPFGWWANATSGGRGANALTNPSLGRQIGSASFHDTLVQVEKAGS